MGNIGDEAQDMADSVSSFTYKKRHYGAGQGHPDAELCWTLRVCVQHTDFSSWLQNFGVSLWLMYCNASFSLFLLGW